MSGPKNACLQQVLNNDPWDDVLRLVWFVEWSKTVIPVTEREERLPWVTIRIEKRSVRVKTLSKSSLDATRKLRSMRSVRSDEKCQVQWMYVCGYIQSMHQADCNTVDDCYPCIKYPSRKLRKDSWDEHRTGSTWDLPYLESDLAMGGQRKSGMLYSSQNNCTCIDRETAVVYSLNHLLEAFVFCLSKKTNVDKEKKPNQLKVF